MNIHEKIEELLEASSSMGSVSYQRKAGYYLIIILASQICPPAGSIRPVGEALVPLEVKDCRKGFTVEKGHTVDGIGVMNDSPSSQMGGVTASAKSSSCRRVPFALYFMSLTKSSYSVSLSYNSLLEGTIAGTIQITYNSNMVHLYL
jgi:hypothetical protein